MGGLCPGPFYSLIPMNNLTVPFYWGISCFVGIKMGEFITFMGKKVMRRKT
jgi:hypothetical protein